MHYQASNTSSKASRTERESMTSIITRAAKINVSKKTTSGAKFAKQNVVFSNDESSADDPALTMSVKDRMKMFQNFQPPVKKFN